MRTQKKLGLGLLVITLAILTGWQLWVWQQSRVPALSTLLERATREAEQTPTGEACFDLLHRVAWMWLDLGETDKARATLNKMDAALRRLTTSEYGGREKRVRILATLYLKLGDVDSALYVARSLIGQSEVFGDTLDMELFLIELMTHTSPERALQWLQEAYHPNLPSRWDMRALWRAATFAGHPEFAEQQARAYPLSVSDLLRLADSYHIRNPARVDALLDEAARLWNTRPEPRAAAGLARALRKDGRTAQAVSIVQAALQRAPQQEAYAWLELAREAHLLDRPALTRAALQRALQDPHRRRLCSNIPNAVDLFQQVGMLAEARRAVAEYGAPNDQVRLLVALDELDEAVRVAQQRPDALSDATLIDALLKAGRVQEAQQLAQVGYNRGALVDLVARRHACRGDAQTALKLLENAPGYQYDSALLSVIERLVEAGRPQEAEQLLHTAPSMHASDWLPSAAAPRIAKGYIDRKQYREAWRIARSLDAPDARASVMLSLAEAI
ncbi:MAG: hypothetical protein NZM28_06110 [Fimbriimonadales bacterium]|nr:hypothetical protein [Fimbriimonadales bacterium]